jgi:integrating conjugative element protein (TIGR03761 family)
LQDLAQSDALDTADPRYPRYVELERREELLRRMETEFRMRDGAEPQVPYREAEKVSADLGRLVDEEEDSIEVHTRDGARLFMGRAIKPGEGGYGLVGAKRIGAALRAVWYLSGNDNPYADCCLVESTSKITGLVKGLNDDISNMEGRLAHLKRRGLSYSVLQAKPPVTVRLGFKSPYGYSLVNLVAAYDYYARVLKTSVRKDLLSDDEGYSKMFTRSRACRALFERVLWWQRFLMRPELQALSRSDWLPGAPEDARKRVEAAIQIFGEMPREIFNGAVTPRHSRRRLVLTPEELRLLNEVPLSPADAELDAATASLVG